MILRILLMLVAATITMSAQSRHASIYFANIRMEGEAQARGDSTATPVGVFPVTRIVPSPVTIKVLMLHLLNGPASTEKENGYTSALEGMKLEKVSFANGMATVRLTGRLNLAGVMAGPRLRLQVEQTLRQLPNVKRIDLMINGKKEFDSLK